jgi:hypothetical protein
METLTRTVNVDARLFSLRGAAAASRSETPSADGWITRLCPAVRSRSPDGLEPICRGPSNVALSCARTITGNATAEE